MSAPSSVTDTSKFHPGDYILFGDNPVDWTVYDAHAALFVGVGRKYRWKDVETGEGVYDFAEIIADLDAAASRNAYVLIEISMTTFNGAASPWVPNYIRNNAIYGGGQGGYYGVYARQAQSGGWLPNFFGPGGANLRARYDALCSAMAGAFGSHAALEGVAGGETAVDPPGAQAAADGGYIDYSTAYNLEAMQHRCIKMREAFPDRTVMAKINYAPYSLTSLAEWCANNGIGLSGPDMHFNVEAKPDLNNVVYPLRLVHHDTVPAGCECQWDNYERWGQTPQYLRDQLITRMNPHYAIWLAREDYFSQQTSPSSVVAVRQADGMLPAAQAFYDDPDGGSGGIGQQNGLIVMEAETATKVLTAGSGAFSGQEWEEYQDTDFVGAGLKTPNNATVDSNSSAAGGGGPTIEIPVQFTETGTHYLWVRGKGESQGNSVWISVGSADPWRVDFSTSIVEWIGDDRWDARLSFSIASAGEHTVKMRQREDGFAVDRFLITQDVGYTPTGEGPAETTTEPPEFRVTIHNPDGCTLMEPTTALVKVT